MGASHASKNPMTLSQSHTYQDRIRHLEYNEAKPTYERCSKGKMKCDGYLPPKPPKPPRRRAKPKAAPAKLAVVPLGYPIHNVPSLISKVCLYFQHLLEFIAT
ncbi:hypothetical protein FOWG_17925 [Fusarium oxysporum f. sp. lycopersici MN25]|uniref:Uncharacterized protein n=1 Tax=Fusarium oxysporum TaxID=5507 RepID=A0A420MPT7_FUSOX|nr:hypothetical protein FOWG_17925 [Fusarium oxysporum f. sp. lycopersici MN25]KAJ4264693.1 hypothetical protein NW764_015809 [Fusarium oxysporum]RKK69978.1 hypothetical protein BFJ69_g12243 [Fusarium oxysporum]